MISKTVKYQKKSFFINLGRKISNLRYADDTALCAESHEEILTLLNNIIEEGKKKNMTHCKKEQSNAFR